MEPEKQTYARPNRRRDRRQLGFTMVEALVALVVLAIGLLGIAALYLDSLRAGRTAIYRTQAVNLAADLADSIRANRSAVADYAVALGDTATAEPACATTAGCTAAELAATDLANWKADLAASLPGGDGSVTVTAGAGGEPNEYQVTVSWTETGQEAPMTFTLAFSS